MPLSNLWLKETIKMKRLSVIKIVFLASLFVCGGCGTSGSVAGGGNGSGGSGHARIGVPF